MKRVLSRISKLKIQYLLIILFVTAAVLSFLLSDIVRSVILPPIFYLSWIARIIYETLPQLFWWSLFLLIFFIISVRSVIRIGWRRSSSAKSEKLKYSRLEMWTKWVEQTNRGQYFKWNLANEISKLFIKLLASEERLSENEIMYRIEENQISIPQEIQTYLMTGLNPQQSLQVRRSIFFPFIKTRTKPLDLDIEQLLEFLEKRTNLENNS